MSKIFLCHASEDKKFVEKLAKDLMRFGFEVWFDKFEMKVGESLLEKINEGIMLMYGKEASNRKQEIDRQHYTIPNQRPKDKHCGKI